MTSVSRRVQDVKQPRGGYVQPKMLDVRYLAAGGPMLLDHNAENLSPALVGSSVDYLARLANGADPHDAFGISLNGAERLGPAEFHGVEWAVGGSPREGA
jgi:hypothetical protein